MNPFRSEDPMKCWNSRRSSVMSTKGMCASSQPLATAAGIKILQAGGNAADAAVAMAAVLNLTEPCSTGIGGDAFSLYYDASSKKVSCLMGNGASSADFSLDLLHSRGIGLAEGMKPLDKYSGLCVTTPGAAALWEDLLKLHGTVSLSEALSTAIELAENGFPLEPVSAYQWSRGFLQGAEAEKVFRPTGKSPVAGELVTNKDLATTFRTVAELGAKEGFYKGRIAEAIVEAVREYEGVLSLDDLDYHVTAQVEPISVVYKGHRVYEVPPPTHGIAALEALKIFEKISPELSSSADYHRGSSRQAHLGIEAMRLAYADAQRHVCDPFCTETSVWSALLSDGYTRTLAEGISVDRASDHVSAEKGAGDVTPFLNGDTVYFCAMDRHGNACSMINSNYMGFGTGIVPKGCGFTLQNRGYNASLIPGHPNQAAPRKRPYHTIIPGIITREQDSSLHCAFGNMGGFMQPMGHFQLVRNMIDFQLSPQAAVDAPRWYTVGPEKVDSFVTHSIVKLEYGYGGEMDGGDEGDNGDSVALNLMEWGHQVEPLVKGWDRSVYGRGQIIYRDPNTGVLWGGSDPRADGCAMPEV